VHIGLFDLIGRRRISNRFAGVQMARLIRYLKHSSEPDVSTLRFRADRVRPDEQMGISSRAWSLRYVCGCFVPLVHS
jgi:hypothetical protein